MSFRKNKRFTKREYDETFNYDNGKLITYENREIIDSGVINVINNTNIALIGIENMEPEEIKIFESDLLINKLFDSNKDLDKFISIMVDSVVLDKLYNAPLSLIGTIEFGTRRDYTMTLDENVKIEFVLDSTKTLCKITKTTRLDDTDNKTEVFAYDTNGVRKRLKSYKCEENGYNTEIEFMYSDNVIIDGNLTMDYGMYFKNDVAMINRLYVEYDSNYHNSLTLHVSNNTTREEILLIQQDGEWSIRLISKISDKDDNTANKFAILKTFTVKNFHEKTNTLEIERKFEIDFIKHGKVIKEIMDKYTISKLMIDQSYISLNPEIRLRNCNNESFELTKKEKYGDSTISRIEKNVSIDKDFYDMLLAGTNGRSFKKTRYIIEMTHDDKPHIFYLDLFEDEQDPVIEVEFTSENEANAFVPPEWFGKEMTGPSVNKKLALDNSKRRVGNPFKRHIQLEHK